jgi:type VI secretion system protein VasJ
MLDRLEPRLGETPLTANDRERVERLVAAAKRFAAVTRDKFGEQAPGLRPLLDNAERLKVSLPAPAAPAPVAQPQAPQTGAQSTAAAASMPAAPSASLASAADSVEFLRKIGESLADAGGTLRRADPKDAAAYRAVRVGLYLHLANPPPAQQGNRTAVPAPPAAMRAQLDTLTQNQKWDALLDEAESALRQYRFWVDLHRYVALALGSLGEPFAKARNEVLAGAGALLRRMPTLATLEFGDGSPFASGATRTWIGSELSSGGGGGGDAGPVSSGGDGALVEARKLVAGGKPAEAVALLQKAASSTSNGRAQFTTRLETAGVCLGAGKPDLARAIYAGLLEEADRRGLHDWEPALLTDLLTAYHKCLKGLAQAGKPVADELLMVYRRLSRVDLEAALRVVG